MTVVGIDSLSLLLAAAGVILASSGISPRLTAPCVPSPAPTARAGRHHRAAMPRLEWRSRPDGDGIDLLRADPADLATIQIQDQAAQLWNSILRGTSRL